MPVTVKVSTEAHHAAYDVGAFDVEYFMNFGEETEVERRVEELNELTQHGTFYTQKRDPRDDNLRVDKYLKFRRN